jgi:hypothetical protein
MSIWDRCITRGTPGGMIPAGYNNAYQIIQVPGYVVIHYEMIHEARIIPLDGRPHPPKSIGLWLGDSRGRWEGQTLVVETTNFNERGWVATSAYSGRLKGIPQTRDARVVERFTRVDANTLKYDVTVTDPAVFTQPWTMSTRCQETTADSVRVPREQPRRAEHSARRSRHRRLPAPDRNSARAF